MRSTWKLAILTIALGLLWAPVVNAAPLGPPNLPPAAFAFTGFIQEATLSGNPGGIAAVPLANSNPNAGGTITINGIKIIVPNNSIVQMPAAAFTWAELFNPATSASVGYAPPRTNHRAGQLGLALADNAVLGTRAGIAGAVGPFPSFQASVVGNIVFNSLTGTQTYIAALIVPIEQQGFNAGAGVVNFIDYAAGRFRVGGIIGNPLSGTLCEINDPIIATPGDGQGRFGKRHSPDPRFTADTNNPTITTSTGWPAGLPITAGVDPSRPPSQRPLNNPASIDPNQPFDPFLPVGAPLKTFVAPTVAQVVNGVTPDPRLQMPIMLGDWVDFTGTLYKINPLGPNTAANMFVSVHTMNLDLGAYTTIGSLPTYVKCDVALIGTDGLNGPVDPAITAGAPPTAIPGEFAARATFEGFCTDAGILGPKFGSATVTAWSVDDATGNLGAVVPNDAGGGPRGNPTSVETVPLGRYVFRTSALVTTPANPVPLTREYRVVHSNGVFNQLVCNGLTAGQFQLPMFEFVTPEHTTMGSPQYPGNYFDLPFLSTLDPFPGTAGGNQPAP